VSSGGAAAAAQPGQANLMAQGLLNMANAANASTAPVAMTTTSTATGGVAPAPAAALTTPTPAATPAAAVPAVTSGGLAFELNEGQTNSSVRYLARTGATQVFLTDTAAVFAVGRSDLRTRDVFQMSLVGANTAPHISASAPLSSHTNYLIGSDPRGWHTNVPQFGVVSYQNVYAGVNLVYHSSASGNFEYDFDVAPGTSPSAVRLHWQGLQALSTDAQGNLLLQTAGGTVVQPAPVIYQVAADGSHQSVHGRYVLLGGTDAGFAIDSYDAARTLVIDPTVSWATYVGGNSDDESFAIATDKVGNSVITGVTASTNFPTTTGVVPGGLRGNTNAFVTKLSASGSRALWSTYLGGENADQGNAITLAPDGTIWLAGTTSSSSFPVLNAYQPALFGTTDAFLTHLSATGDGLLSSTFYTNGASQVTHGLGVALGADGSPFLAGDVVPTTTPFGVIAHFDATGATAVYQTLLSSNSHARDVAVLSTGSAYVAGDSGGTIALWAVGTGGGTTGPYSPGSGQANSLAVGPDGTVYLTGSTPGSLSTTGGAYQSTFGGGASDAFVAKWSPGTATYTYVSYVGGAADDVAEGIVVDAQGNFTIAGKTTGSFPTTAGAFQSAYGGGTNDGFVTRFTPKGLLNYSTLLGGGNDDQATDVALAPGGVIVSGLTSSTNFPTTSGAFQTTNQGGYDAFVVKLPLGFSVFGQAVSATEGTALASSTTVALVSGLAAAPASATIDWGDGTTPSTVTPVAANAGTYLVQGGHTYAEEQATPYTISVSVNDGFGHINTGTSQATVADAALTANPKVSALADINLGTALTNTTVATFTDADVNGVVADYTNSNTTINWGDGSATQTGSVVAGAGQTFLVQGSHTYAAAGAYSISVSIADAVARTTAVATINVKPPAGTLTDLTANGSGIAQVTPDPDPLFDPNASGDQSLSSGPGPDRVTLGPDEINANTGGVVIRNPLDFDLSPGTGVGGHPELVYSSDSVSITPIIDVSLTTDPAGSVPADLKVQLTWNGVAQLWQTFSTFGHSAGDTYLLAVQAPSAVLTSGLIPYSVEVKGTGTSIDATISGNYLAAVNGATPYLAYGWGIAGVDVLTPVSSGSVSGILWAYGAGGTRFFAGAGSGAQTYTSPADDFGTLVKNAGGNYTYTAIDQVKRNFDSSGRLTSVVDPHGLALTYSYDGSGRLTQVSAPDGGTTTLTYGSNGIAGISEPGGRSLTLAVDSNHNLTSLSDAANQTRSLNYDSGHRLTHETWAPFSVTLQYDSSTQRLTSINQGLGTSYTLVPEQMQGLFVSSTTPAANVSAHVAVLTDPLSHATTLTLDSAGRLLKEATADGGTQTWARNAGGLDILYIDPLNNATLRTWVGANLATEALPDGGYFSYQYDPTYLKVTQTSNSAGETTSAAYDPNTGDLTSATDGVGATRTYTYYQAAGHSTGQVSTVTDPLTHVSSYSFDSNRRQQTYADALNHVWTTGYDSYGNASTVTDPLTHVQTTGFDAINRLTLTSDGAGDTTTYALDAFGDTTGMTDANHNASTYTFDQRGFETVDKQPAGRTTTYNYDTAGRATTITDANNHVTTVTFDPVGRELTRTVSLGGTTTATTSMGWDLAGNQTSATDPLNHTTTYNYDPVNRQTSVTDALVHTSYTKYNTVGLVTATIDANGNVTGYGYDKDERQTSITDATGATSLTSFDKAGNVTTTTDPNGNNTVYNYDNANRQTLVTDALGKATTQNYDNANRLTSSTDPLTHTTTYLYDNADRRTGVTDALNHTALTKYDGNGNVTQVVDRNNNPTNFGFDGLNQRTSVTDALTKTLTTKFDPVGNVTAVVDQLNNTTTYNYDPANRMTSIQDALLRYATYNYDAGGRATTISDFKGKVSTYTFDDVNRQVSAKDPDNNVTTTAYDPVGNVTKVVDGNGDPAYTAYDGDNRVIAQEDYDGNVASTYYDPAGNVTLASDYAGHFTAHAFDPLNRATRTTDPMGFSTATAFDSAGRATSVTDPRGNATLYGFDNADRTTTITDPYSNVTTLAYDNFGNRTSVTDPTSKTTLFYFDGLNRQTKVTDANSHSSSIGFDPVGRLTSQTDANNHTTAVGFDAVGRQTTLTDGNGHTTATGYDNQDHVTSVTDPNNWTTTYNYDDAGLKTQAIDPQGNSATFSYDHDKRVTAMTDRLGRSTTYAYDADGNVIGETWRAAGGSITNTLTLTYDGDSHLTSAANNVGTITYAYNDNEQLTQSTDVWGLQQVLSYDGNGNRIAVADSKGGLTVSVYDKDNELTSRKFADGTAQLRFDQGFTARGEVSSLTRYQDTAGTQQAGITSYTYDNVAGLVKSIYHYGGGTPAQPYSGTVLASYVYSYDPVNLLKTQQVNGGAVLTYVYDNANEVTADGLVTYTWDNAGNRNNANFSQGSNKGNQLATDGTWTYSYDAEGNVVQKSKGPSGETWVFTYDNANELTSAEDRPTPNGVASIHIDYKYDALGHMVERIVTSGGTTTTQAYSYDTDGNVWADTDGSGNLQVRRLYTDSGDLVARISYSGTTATVAWYGIDRQGTVTDVMSNSGALLDHRGYDAFGNIVSETTPSNGDRFGYTGQPLDTATGLQNNGARWYSAAIQRWMGRDPIEFAGGQANLYQYVGNDASNLVDPSGLIKIRHWRDFDVSGAFAGGTITQALIPLPGWGAAPGALIGGFVDFGEAGNNRLQGVGQMVMGAGEVVGGVFASPSGLPGFALIVHGADNVLTGLMQTISGEREQTFTQKFLTAWVLAAYPDMPEAQAKSNASMLELILGLVIGGRGGPKGPPGPPQRNVPGPFPEGAPPPRPGWPQNQPARGSGPS
jgi:RHS repeat-associated protein